MFVNMKYLIWKGQNNEPKRFHIEPFFSYKEPERVLIIEPFKGVLFLLGVLNIALIEPFLLRVYVSFKFNTPCSSLYDLFICYYSFVVNTNFSNE